MKSHVVDMIEMKDYESHDVDEDPIIVLPCGHFYSSSTMDGLLGMNEVYEMCNRTGEFIGLQSLMSANVNEKPSVCPDCRAGIHSVRRYGRVLNLKVLRSLERKHLFFVKYKLVNLQRLCGDGAKYDAIVVLKKIAELEADIMKSPMRKVKEACSLSGSSMEVPQPPVIPLLGLLELRGRIYSEQIGKYMERHASSAEASDKLKDLLKMAEETYSRGLAIADGSESKRSGANLRLAFTSLLCRVNMTHRLSNDNYKEEAEAMMDWIIAQERILGSDLVTNAQQMKHQVKNEDNIIEVVKAMSAVSGYNYGGSWSSHWYECPNGHPYFIGECGVAMQEANCIECGARVGGIGHQLVGTNRRSDLVARVQAAAGSLP